LSIFERAGKVPKFWLDYLICKLSRKMLRDTAIRIFNSESKIAKPMWDFSRDVYFKGFEWKV